MQRPRIFVLIPILAIGVGCFVSQPSKAATPQQPGVEAAKTGSGAAKHVVYKNKQYGFEFSLPISWKGYSIVAAEWSGGVVDGGGHYVQGSSEKGPLIRIRNPRWTDQNPYQDIPIMIFTREQWEMIEDDSLNVSAAPFGPGEIGRNAKYVFALPPRYNYADGPGVEEVSEMFQHHPLRPIQPR